MICDSNPYSTRFTKPGAIPFLYPERLSRSIVLEGLRASGWQAEIAGPHGSGKSTLVKDLLPALKQRFQLINQVTVRVDSLQRWDIDWTVISNQSRMIQEKLIIIDGVERLSRVKRWLISQVCRQRKIGLLATVHRPRYWLPTIAVIDPQRKTFLRIAEQLQQDCTIKLNVGEIESAFELANQNCREALMALYDRYERARISRTDNNQLISSSTQVAIAMNYLDGQT